MKLHKNDKVYVISGDDKGKTGIVLMVDRKAGTVLVEGVNTYQKHTRKTGNEPGGLVTRIRPIPASKLKVVCGSCGKPTRVRYTGTGKEKIRICSLCQKPVSASASAK